MRAVAALAAVAELGDAVLVRHVRVLALSPPRRSSTPPIRRRSLQPKPDELAQAAHSARQTRYNAETPPTTAAASSTAELEPHEKSGKESPKPAATLEPVSLSYPTPD